MDISQINTSTALCLLGVEISTHSHVIVIAILILQGDFFVLSAYLVALHLNVT